MGPDFSRGEYDCVEGYSSWESGWSLAKKRGTWCCFHEGRGCVAPAGAPAPPPGTARPSPTPAARASRTSSTTAISETASTTSLVDCQGASAADEKAWSLTDRKYCCIMASRGCEDITTVVTTTTTEPPQSAEYDCSVGVSYWNELWSVEKKEGILLRASASCLPRDHPGGAVL
ncbi:unnamed protein product [Prorocentrum cordatum]|uniref:Uncharacterized protein n=1 Tax=Prorocentrum cordatum TaxID=2364126 RepID=A0ABN9UL36_9DINO|nr:unnamed protein product [Polarella glacialis]